MASEIGKRVLQIRKKLSLSQQRFADKAGVHRAYINDVENGRKDPSFNMLVSICDTYNIRSDWLLTGEGPMYRQPQAANDGPPETAPPLSEPKKRLLELYDALDKDGQEQVRGCAEDQKRMQDLEKELQALKKKVGT